MRSEECYVRFASRTRSGELTKSGISRMKGLARSFVWWPSIDIESEYIVEKCQTCHLSIHLPPKVPLRPWKWPLQLCMIKRGIRR